MARYKFKQGQRVHLVVSEDCKPIGNYVIVRLMPVVDGVARYRIRSTRDVNECVVSEESLVGAAL
jgi:hypothetical protein